jgi:hypothetical protein
MARATFQLNHAELRKLLQNEALDECNKIGEQILAIVGEEHYEIEDWVGQNRGRVTVRTRDDFHSMGHEAKHHKLIQALGQIAGGLTEDPNELIEYTSAAGRVSMRTRAEVANYTRNRNG